MNSFYTRRYNSQFNLIFLVPVLFMVLTSFSPLKAQYLPAFPRDFQSARKIIDLHEYEYLFAENGETFEAFSKFNRSRLTQKYGNYFFVGVTALTVIGLTVETNGNAAAAIFFIIPIASLAIGIYAGLFNLIINPIKNNRKHKLLSLYFDQPYFGYKETIKINFGIQTSGIGIGMSF